MDADPHLFIIANIPCAIFFPPGTENVVCFVIGILLLMLLAAVSAAEAAFMSLTPETVKGWEEDHRSDYRRMVALMREPEKLLATMQVTGALVNIALVVLVAHAAFSMVAPGGLTTGAVALITVVMILLLLVFGEIVPRMYASQNAPKVLPRSSLLLLALQRIFYPLSAALAWSTAAVHRQAQKRQSISIDDLSSALEKTSETPENENILKGIVKFGNIDAHTVMTPRMDVESVDMTTGLAELMELINEWGYSRIPAYDDAPDNVKGILYVKDLLPYIEEKDDFPWQKLIRDAYFVPEHKKIDDLLKEFQEMKMHMAVIIDEYGGMVGIVTLEDILEEIVGDIADESDDDEQEYIKLDENTYLFDGKVLLNDFFRIMRLDESDFEQVRGEADTLAGVILEMKGEIPQKGDCADYMHLSFCVESVDNHRIKQIKVVVHGPEEK
ncbi:MAG: gliding motility-associated protein GldE [Bacteroidales bacterium]|nr:gliding motility-associated protein GldE [Bacteroidales bacterium]